VKHRITKKIYLELLLDGSQMIMFQQGGKHKINLCTSDLCASDEDQEIEITIALDKGQKQYYDWVNNQPKQTNYPS
jgi:hypothetical protein